MIKDKFRFQIEDEKWGKHLKDYEYSKKHLEWKFNPKPKYITHKQLLYNDREFNPITQRYSDENIEKEMKKKEEQILKKSISQNFEKQFKYEKEYDIINNRLKKISQDKIINSDKKIKFSCDSNVPYNIISNLSLNVHNPIPPNQRINYIEPEIKKKPILIKSYLYKDYDILTNKYKNFDKEKKKIDRDFEKLTSISQLNSRRDYDIIKNKFYNEELNKKDNNKPIVGNLIPFKGQIYNPINMKPYDNEKLNEIKQKELSSRLKKFKIRSNLDQYYHFKNEDNLQKEMKNKINHCNYSKYANIDQRGYDILNFENNYHKYVDNFKMKNNLEPWYILKNNVGKNETISKKKLYLVKTKNQELEDKFKEFKTLRSQQINNFNILKDKENFQIKLRNNEIKPLNKSFSQPIFKINKQDWFGI
jgi:hypothetical protein